MDRDSAKSLFQRAQEFFEADEFGDALHLLTELASEFPDDKNILFAQARCLDGIGRRDDAAALCRRILDRWEAPRAEVLLAKIDASMAAENADDSVRGTKGTQANSRLNWRTMRRAFIAGIGAVAVAIAWQFSLHVEDAPASASDPYTKSELRKAGAPVKLPDAGVQPGQFIPEPIWMRTAVNGLPLWEPGIYHDVKCPGAFFESPQGEVLPRTIDVYIPLAYHERPAELFPTVAISMARPKRGFMKLQNWAEQNDVILITINSSSNKTYGDNWRAQDAAIMTVISSRMRVDQRMGFAIGMSGGAATSWEMICRYPENFVGLVMMGMSNGHNDCWVPRHVRVGYIYGETDHNVPALESNIPRLRSMGNEIRISIVPGGHVMGPIEEREKMLTWMLLEAREELGTMTKSDATR